MKVTLEIIKEAIWRSGFGPDALLVIEDGEFRDMMKSYWGYVPTLVPFDGYMAMKVEYMCSTVFVSCPRMKLPDSAVL